ncbi:fumarylacetoacetase [Sphingobium sp. DC-2]|uniref:fumarylacetoacetase n=1 Tax=Sphingobium sp. DC-2 TaxID=1303256 RepID=UPI0004C3B9AF|nr:fumarylacetoacetase [Sphingobium sp. DC-2]
MTGRMDETHDPALTSWVESANGHPQFPIQNLPFGIFSIGDGERRAGVAIGDLILDLAVIAGHLPASAADAVSASTLNALFALPAADRRALRRSLSSILSDAGWRDRIAPALHAADGCTLHLPATIGDYTDFYVGIHHAENVGRLFRPDNPLLPNYKWVPIGYHGRASSVRPSGEPVRRPLGQRKAPDADSPVFGPTQRLDYELELGVWVGQGNPLGQPIPIGEAADHIVGLGLLNDWSARDLQAWEYQPLGPFLAKNFHTTISPWVVTVEALAPFRIAQPVRPEGDPDPLPYLNDPADRNEGAFAIEMAVLLSSERMRAEGLPPIRLSRGPASNMYWTVAQIVAHHASNGCNLRPGDLLGTGTISGAEAGERGSLLELSEGGKSPIALPSGEERRFLEDGDELTIAATASREGAVPIGFGPCTARILPALS